jgi:uncharacterized protein (DUF433 family)
MGYRYITRVPGVRSGHAIIEGTRIGVHNVIGLLQTGSRSIRRLRVAFAR